MPDFDRSANSNRADPTLNNGGYSKILAIFNRNDEDQSVHSRANRVSITLKDSIGYNNSVANLMQDTYESAAGGDLSSIFIPYQTSSSGIIPSFNRTISEDSFFKDGFAPSSIDLQPFRWKSSESAYIYDRSVINYGDSLPYLISGESYKSDVEQFRDISNIRGVGIRLPAMAAGWGYTTEGYPWPSGQDYKNKFKGDHVDGWMVDPTDYIAAPIDLRYDTRKNVWGAPQGFWAEITGFSGVNGAAIYSWNEVYIDGNFDFQIDTEGKNGSFLDNFALETNGNRGIITGTYVWMQIRDKNNCYVFDCGLTNEINDNSFTYNKNGYLWNNDGIIWQTGVRYLQGQEVGYLNTGLRYVSTIDHDSNDFNGPQFGPWIPISNAAGVNVKLPVIDENGDEFAANFYWDSHGHLIVINQESSSSSSSSLSSSSGASSGCPNCIGVTIAGTVYNLIRRASTLYQTDDDSLIAVKESGIWEMSTDFDTWHTTLSCDNTCLPTDLNCWFYSSGVGETLDSFGECVDQDCPECIGFTVNGHKHTFNKLTPFIYEGTDSENHLFKTGGIWRLEIGELSYFSKSTCDNNCPPTDVDCWTPDPRTAPLESIGNCSVSSSSSSHSSSTQSSSSLSSLSSLSSGSSGSSQSSSGASSGSSGCNCGPGTIQIDVVTNVTFNTSTCEVTITTTKICAKVC